MSSLSFPPPGCSGRLRGWGKGDGCCDSVAEEAGGVGRSARSGLAIEAIVWVG